MYDSKPDTLFVYGTLKKVKKVKKVCGIEPTDVKNAKVKGTLYRVDWYPILVLDEPKGNQGVYGKVLFFKDLDDKKLFELDKFEGVDEGLYFRKIIEVVMEENTKLKCWVYIGNVNHPKIKRYIKDENVIKTGIFEECNYLRN